MLHRDPMQPAVNARALMRSRYTAFVLGLEDYLVQTWHPTTRPAQVLTDHGTRQWLGLKVLRSEQQSPDSATVEFVARSRLPGQRADRLHETSRFVLENGRWLYLDGEIQTRDNAP